MRYRVRFSAQGRADIRRLLRALADRSPEAATRLNVAFEGSIRRLAEFPFACGRAYESASFPEEIRHLLFGTNPKRKYRALYTVRGDEVVILAVRAPGERPVPPGGLGDG